MSAAIPQEPTAPPASSPGGKPAGLLLRTEWIAGALVLLALVALRVNFTWHAGGLWRDEVHSIDVARDSRFPLWKDSFPILWTAALRLWTTLSGSSTDFTARLAGLASSLLAIAAAVWAPQCRRKNVPWATLVLLGLNPIFVTYGTEVRGYALGVATQLWMFGAVARWLLQPSRGGAINLVVASLVAVQAAYVNSFLLLAASLSGGFVCLFERRWKALLFLALNGIVAALSVSPYVFVLLPMMTADWAVIVRRDPGLSWYLEKMTDTIDAGGDAAAASWWLLLCLLSFRTIHEALRPRARLPANRGAAGGFELLLLVFSTTLAMGYLSFLKVRTEEWYYLPVLATWAYCIDSRVSAWLPTSGVRAIGLAAILLVGAIQFPSAWKAANVRMTNVDLMARAIADQATERDLIVVVPWHFGIPMERYYHGPAPWTCLPAVEGREVEGIMIHADGYRAVKAAMIRETPIAGELARIRRTLREGGRVYVLGQMEFLREGERPVELPPAPNSIYGWSGGAYDWAWKQQLSFELQSQRAEIRPLSLECQQAINPFETCQVYVASRPAAVQKATSHPKNAALPGR
jgi:hypothetical protein